MRITIGSLKNIIREEIERNMRWTAGFFGGGQSGGYSGGDGVVPFPGLGDEEENYNGKEEQEEFEQPGARSFTDPARSR